MLRILQIFIFILLIWLGVSLWLHLTVSYSQEGSDFIQDYLAALSLRRGESIYGPGIPALGIALLEQGNENFHPPFCALLFYPLSYLSFETGFITWNALSALLYISVTVATIRIFKISATNGAFLLPLFLSSYPFVFSMAEGQISPFLTFLIVSGWIALRKNCESLAGAFWALAMLIKLFPGLLIFYLILRKKWRASLTWFLTAIIGLAVTAAVVGVRDLSTYVFEIAPRNTHEWVHFPINQSLFGFVANLHWSDPWSKLTAVIASIVIAIIFFRAISRSTPTLDDGDRIFFLTCCTMLILSPLTWSHMFLVFTPALLWSFQYWEGEGTWQRKLMMLGFVLLALPDVYIARWAAAQIELGQALPGLTYSVRMGFAGLIILFFGLQFSPRRST